MSVRPVPPQASVAVGVMLVLIAACMPPERINASCEWVDSVRTADQSPSARRRHIEEDVRVAQDLGIRYGDSVAGRVWDDANRTARQACTNALIDSAMRRHSASRTEIEAAIGARIAWPDVLVVFLPVLLIFGAASRVTVRAVARGYESADRLMPVVILVILTPIAALVGVAFGQIWAAGVEEIRMRSDHLSFRAAYLPLHTYKVAAFLVAGTVFALVAAGYRRHLGRRPWARR